VAREPAGSSPYLQKPVTGPYPEPTGEVPSTRTQTYYSEAMSEKCSNGQQFVFFSSLFANKDTNNTLHVKKSLHFVKKNLQLQRWKKYQHKDFGTQKR
jgi:hypothetical protein